MSHRALGQQFIDLYHGTTSGAAREIDEHGIKASRDLGLVHLTSSETMAEDYARKRVERDSGMMREGAAVVHVRVPADKVEPGWFAGHGHVTHRGDVHPKHIQSIYELEEP